MRLSRVSVPSSAGSIVSTIRLRYMQKHNASEVFGNTHLAVFLREIHGKENGAGSVNKGMNGSGVPDFSGQTFEHSIRLSV